jgi:hypothetical protein
MKMILDGGTNLRIRVLSKNKLINARSETVTEKPSFKDAIQTAGASTPGAPATDIQISRRYLSGSSF